MDLRAGVRADLGRARCRRPSDGHAGRGGPAILWLGAAELAAEARLLAGDPLGAVLDTCKRRRRASPRQRPLGSWRRATPWSRVRSWPSVPPSTHAIRKPATDRSVARRRGHSGPGPGATPRSRAASIAAGLASVEGDRARARERWSMPLVRSRPRGWDGRRRGRGWQPPVRPAHRETSRSSPSPCLAAGRIARGLASRPLLSAIDRLARQLGAAMPTAPAAERDDGVRLAPAGEPPDAARSRGPRPRRPAGSPTARSPSGPWTSATRPPASTSRTSSASSRSRTGPRPRPSPSASAWSLLRGFIRPVATRNEEHPTASPGQSAPYCRPMPDSTLEGSLCPDRRSAIPPAGLLFLMTVVASPVRAAPPSNDSPAGATVYDAVPAPSPSRST